MLNAQRRPGSKPRRHRSVWTRSWRSFPALNEGRGRNPGDTRHHRQHRRPIVPLNEGRGRNPGDTILDAAFDGVEGIAQRRPGSKPRRHVLTIAHLDHDVTTLNEGRGRNPGDTREGCLSVPGFSARSTKAGVETPATLDALSAQRVRDDRSTKAGVETPATHGGIEVDPHRQARSTKAGVETPATPASCDAVKVKAEFAQRRPGSKPRRHPHPATP